MGSEIKRKLNNAPIKEVIIGLAVEDLFETPNEIVNFYDKSCLKETFCNKNELKAVRFEISENPKILKDVSPGYVFANPNKYETVFIGLNTIRYSNKSKYEGYEKFIKKFANIVDNIFSYCNGAFKVKEAGLRYINRFNIEAQHLGNEFLMSPTVRISKNPENTDTLYATMNNYLSMANIQSQRYSNVFATIKTVYKPVSQQLLGITFDIDTHDTTSYTLSRKEDLYEKISYLKEFKNLIFFSNFKNAYEMKEFQ